MDLSDITRLISSLRAQTARDSITPNGLGSILQRIVDAISSMSGIDVEDEAAILQRLSAAESNASTALQAAQNAQAGAAGNVIDSFTQSQDEDEVSLSIKQHGHSAKQVVLPAASSTGAGIMTATDKSHLDTAYGKRVNLMSAPSSESVVTLTITFGDGTTKSVTFVGATAGTGGKAGLMTKEQADQLAALVAAGTAESVRDDAGYLKQQYAAPVILRNVSDETIDDLSVGDIFYDAGKLWQCGTTENTDMGAPSKKVIYYCLADQTLYRWTGSRFVQAVSISSGDVTVPTKLSDLINDMGFLTAHQPLKTINGQTITGTGNITIDGAAELKDASSHIKQSVATPVVLRNVTDSVPDVLNIGDIYYDSGILWCYNTPDTHNLGAPSKNLVYFCLANNSFYRWTGSSFTPITTGGGGASEILALNGMSSNQDGTIVFTDTAGNTYTVNLNHTHENMAKLEIVDEEPSSPALDTIYALVDDAEDPTEIQSLWIAGLKFVGGGVPDTGMPQVTKPSPALPLNLGNNTGSGVTALVDVKARNLNYNGSTDGLTVSVGQNSGLLLSYDQTVDATSITIPQLDAETGCQITVKYTGSGALNDGALVFSHDNAVLASVVVVVVVPVPTTLTAIKMTGTQWLQTDYKPNANTEFELDVKFSGFSSSGGGQIMFDCAMNTIADTAKLFRMYYTGSGAVGIKFANEESITNPSTHSIQNVSNAAVDGIRGIIKYIKESGHGTFSCGSSSVETTLKSSKMENALKIGHGRTSNTGADAISNFTEFVIYGFVITENGTTVRNYVPAELDGEAGLYDTITGAFHTSASSSSIIGIE